MMKFNIRRNLMGVLLNIFSFFKLEKTKQNIKKNEIKKILVITCTGVGNMLMFKPALNELKNKTPHATFTLIHMDNTAKQIFKDLHMFEKYMHIEKNIWELIKVIINVKKERYDISINGLISSRNILACIPYLTRIPWRIGFVNGEDYKNKLSFTYNKKIKMKARTHEIERRLQLIEPINGKKIKTEKYALNLDKKEIQFAEKFFRECKINKNDVKISINIGSGEGQKWKRWSIKKYAKLISLLMNDGYKIILNGSEEERKEIKKITRYLKNKPAISAGKTDSIKEAAAIISLSDLSVGNDNGLMHVSAAVKTPTITLFGPTNWERTAPQGIDDTIIKKKIGCSPCYTLLSRGCRCSDKKNKECLEKIEVKEVYNKVKKKLCE